MTTASRGRFAELVRAEPIDVGLAALLVGAEVEPDLDVDESLALLDALAAAARRHVPGDASPAEAAEGLRVALGQQAGFAGTAEDYDDVRSSLLSAVLRRRRGLPLLLSVVWVEVAARLGVAAYYCALPGQVVVGIGDPEDEHVVVDPFNGGRPVPGAQVDLLPPQDLLLRLLTNIRLLTTRQERALDAARTRLWAVELSLLLPRHPLALRRERGELLVRLGAHLEGAAELEAYAALVEDVDPAAAEACRRGARQALARLN
jgi:regulator of sirC expression with transglutaminase-like and TPR domain